MSSKGPYVAYIFIVDLEYVTGRSCLTRLRSFGFCIITQKHLNLFHIRDGMHFVLSNFTPSPLSAAFQKTNLKAANVRACPRLNFGWMKLQIHGVLPLPLSLCLSLSFSVYVSLPLLSISSLCFIASCLHTAWCKQVRSEMWLCQVGLMSGLNMWKECHFEITAENGEAELQTDADGYSPTRDTHACAHADTDVHPGCINSRQKLSGYLTPNEKCTDDMDVKRGFISLATSAMEAGGKPKILHCVIASNPSDFVFEWPQPRYIFTPALI